MIQRLRTQRSSMVGWPKITPPLPGFRKVVPQLANTKLFGGSTPVLVDEAYKPTPGNEPVPGGGSTVTPGSDPSTGGLQWGYDEPPTPSTGVEPGLAQPPDVVPPPDAVLPPDATPPAKKTLPTETSAYFAQAAAVYKQGAADGSVKAPPSYTPDPALSSLDVETFAHLYKSAYNANSLIQVPLKRVAFAAATREALYAGVEDGYNSAAKWHEPAQTWWVGYKEDLDRTYEYGYSKGQSLLGADATLDAKAPNYAAWLIVGGLGVAALVFGAGYVLAAPEKRNPAPERAPKNDREREEWVWYDAYLRNMQEHSPLSAKEFVRQNRAEIDRYAFDALRYGPSPGSRW